MARMVRRGDRVILDQKVRFERQVRTADGGGGASVSWQTAAEPWARVEPLSGRERWQAQQTENPTSYRLTLRYRTDIQDSDRIVWAGHPGPLRITFIARPSTRDRYMQIDCTAGVETP